MHPPRLIPVRSLWHVAAALSVACVGCTAGHVTKDGSPVQGAEVHVWTCEDLDELMTTTDAGGNFKFNPFDPGSPAFDSSQYVPTGPIAIAITGGDGSMVTRRNHQYTDECPVHYNGSTQSQPCKVYDLDLEPMTVVEFLGELNDFLADDCGLEAEIAGGIVAAAIGRDVREIGSLTAKPSEESCLLGCSQGCQGQPIVDFADCMCICVENACKVSFGPFCTESAG